MIAIAGSYQYGDSECDTCSTCDSDCYEAVVVVVCDSADAMHALEAKYIAEQAAGLIEDWPDKPEELYTERDPQTHITGLPERPFGKGGTRQEPVQLASTYGGRMTWAAARNPGCHRGSAHPPASERILTRRITKARRSAGLLTKKRLATPLRTIQLKRRGLRRSGFSEMNTAGG